IYLNIVPFHPAKLSDLLTKCGDARTLLQIVCDIHQRTHLPHPFIRTRNKGIRPPDCREANQCEEISSLHSIPPSAGVCAATAQWYYPRCGQINYSFRNLCLSPPTRS